MNVYYATLSCAYEAFVTMGMLVILEVVLTVLKYLPLVVFSPALNPLPPGLWYFSLIIALILTLVIDLKQIYGTALDDEIQSLTTHAVRVAANYVMYAFLVTILAFRFGFNTNYFTEAQIKSVMGQASTIQNWVDVLLLDATNISLGRFFITVIETVVAGVYKMMGYHG